MKENENINIEDLLLSEKNFRESGDYTECLNICLQILNEKKFSSNNDQYNIISKLFLYPNQSNYVRIYLMHALFQNDNFINSNHLKKKYYQLLINSFKKDNSKDLSNQKNDIINLYEKITSDNFDDIDKYIVTFVSAPSTLFTKEEQKEKYETEKNFIINDDNKDSSHRNKSLCNTFFTSSLSSSVKRLDQQENLLPQSSIQTSFEDFNINRQNDGNISIQKIVSVSEKKKNEIKQLLKKYKTNTKLPLIIMSVSANLSKCQFLDVIKNTFLKLNYKLICNIKDTEYENLNIYEYHSKNCCEKFKYIFKNNIKNQFQVSIILKSDENDFTKGIHTFLNDINERKISIKSVKGNEQNIIQFFINFLSKLCDSINKFKIIKQSKGLLKYNLEETIQKLIQNKKNYFYKSKKFPKNFLYNSQNSNYKKLIEDETYVEKTNAQAKKYYELYKILSKGEYELGKSIKNFVDDFKKKYQNLTSEQIKTIKTKNIMSEVVKILELCTNTLNSTYNNYKEEDISYFSLASEQFIFNKIYYMLYNIYEKKYRLFNKKFLDKKKEINEKLEIDEIFQKIGVKKKFRGSEKIPYKSVIDKINMIPLEKSLKKKLEILTQASLEIRTYILEYTNGKYELDSMDDELPIIIFIVTQVNVTNLFAELNIVDDYIKSILRDDFIQNKMVTNLMSSLIFVSNTWNSETLSFDKNLN